MHGQLHRCLSPCRTHPSSTGKKALAELVLWLLKRAVDDWAAGYKLQSRVAPKLEGLPPPMLPSNVDQPTTLCILPVGAQLIALLQLI